MSWSFHFFHLLNIIRAFKIAEILICVLYKVNESSIRHCALITDKNWNLEQKLIEVQEWSYISVYIHDKYQ